MFLQNIHSLLYLTKNIKDLYKYSSSLYHSSSINHGQQKNSTSSVPFTNMFDDSISRSSILINRLTKHGFVTSNNLKIRGPILILNKNLFLWDVPQKVNGGGKGVFDEWNKDFLKIFEIVIPKPELLIFGTGQRFVPIPLEIKNYIYDLGMQLDAMDSDNAASTFNVLTEEGRNVAAALLPIYPTSARTDAGVYDIATLQAVALHDTVEDTNTTFDEVTAKLWTLIITILYCIITRQVSVVWSKHRVIAVSNNHSIEKNVVKEEQFDIVMCYQKFLKDDPDVSMPIAAIEALVELIKHSKEFMESLKDASQLLKSTVKNSISLSAGADLFLRFVTRTSHDVTVKYIQLCGCNFEACKEHLMNSGKVLVEKATAARHKIAELGTTKILRKYGIPAIVILDTAAGYIIDKVDAVFVGAEGVVENGGLINAIGTYQLAIVAKAANKPFYAVIESYKFVRIFPLNQYDLPTHTPDLLTFPDLENKIHVKKIGESNDDDETKIDLGVLTPSGVSDELIKLYL
nr:7034_t:CDS:10 [Entrophospora candida]